MTSSKSNMESDSKTRIGKTTHTLRMELFTTKERRPNRFSHSVQQQWLIFQRVPPSFSYSSTLSLTAFWELLFHHYLIETGKPLINSTGNQLHSFWFLSFQSLDGLWEFGTCMPFGRDLQNETSDFEQ